MNQFQQNVRSQLASLDARPADDPEDDDDMVLGDEAGAGFAATMSDDDGHASHSLNVSPTIDDDDEPPQLIDQKILGGPSAKPTHHISNDVHDRKTFSAISNDDYDDLYDDDNNNNNQSRGSNQRTPVSIFFCFNILKLFFFYFDQNSTNDQHHGISSAQQRSPPTNSYNDHISNSTFSPTIQKWLRDTVDSQSNNRSTISHDKPWSKSSRPTTLNSLHRDIQRYHGLNDLRNTIEASKKMLKNGVLG